VEPQIESITAAPPEASRPTPLRGIPTVQPSQPAVTADEGQLPGLPPPTPKTDTGEMSIWEVFGMRRPSEANQDALDYLVKSVQSKQRAARRIDGRMPKRPVRARYVKTAVGLRLRLIMASMRVRLYHSDKK
jgi:hypothetical protein